MSSNNANSKRLRSITTDAEIVAKMPAAARATVIGQLEQVAKVDGDPCLAKTAKKLLEQIQAQTKLAES